MLAEAAQALAGPLDYSWPKIAQKLPRPPAIVFTSLPLNFKGSYRFRWRREKGRHPAQQLVNRLQIGRHPYAGPPATQPTAQPNTHRKVSIGQTIIPVARRPWSKNIFHSTTGYRQASNSGCASELHAIFPQDRRVLNKSQDFFLIT